MDIPGPRPVFRGNLALSALFHADAFVKSYGRKEVLKSASAWASSGRVSFLVGRNGCGKTTLLRSAVGLMRAELGVVHFDGAVHASPQLSHLASRGLFFLPDKGLLAKRWRFGRQLELVTTRFAVESSGHLVEQFGVEELLDRYPHEMSGGERRMAELALAFARRPRCLLADEPLAGVEPKDRGLVRAMLRTMADSGTAILATGHEVDDLMSLADEVIWMTAGTTHGIGSPEEAANHQQFRREYLG